MNSALQGSGSKAQNDVLNDPVTKRELEKMRSKMHKISAQLLASKLEYCLENHNLRESMRSMRDFS